MMTKNNTAAPVDASECDPQDPNGSLTFTIDMAALRRMDMTELKDFRKVMNTTADVLCGFSSQPRFSVDNTYNQAGELIDEIIDFINRYEAAAINVARAAKPATAAEAESRAWTLLGYGADMRDDLASLAVGATEAVRDVVAAGRGGLLS